MCEIGHFHWHFQASIITLEHQHILPKCPQCGQRFKWGSWPRSHLVGLGVQAHGGAAGSSPSDGVGLGHRIHCCCSASSDFGHPWARWAVCPCGLWAEAPQSRAGFCPHTAVHPTWEQLLGQVQLPSSSILFRFTPGQYSPLMNKKYSYSLNSCRNSIVCILLNFKILSAWLFSWVDWQRVQVLDIHKVTWGSGADTGQTPRLAHCPDTDNTGQGMSLKKCSKEGKSTTLFHGLSLCSFQ